MANEEHLSRLNMGVEVWNAWRQEHLECLDVAPDLSGADFRGAHLREANLSGANLYSANLSRQDLYGANFEEADLRRADLRGAKLRKANLRWANLEEANLEEANLEEARLKGADLRGADLAEADLSGIDFCEANLYSANLYSANLRWANLRRADLQEADLRRTDVRRANLQRANLSGADLSEADLEEVNFKEADLRKADLSGADFQGAKLSDVELSETLFANVDLSTTKGLETCKHKGPSIVDHRTLQRSGRLSLTFLRGCGLPDRLIDYLPSLLGEAIQYYSCFISYSSKDDAFAQRLHADLQNNGVRCWFAPHDLPIGAKTWDAIDEAIRLRDKVLLILSKQAIDSDWVEDEVTKGFAEERRRNQLVLFPVRIDDTVLKTGEAWAVKLRDQRNIGDFRKWKDHDAYQQAFDQVLRDLKTVPG